MKREDCGSPRPTRLKSSALMLHDDKFQIAPSVLEAFHR